MDHKDRGPGWKKLALVSLQFNRSQSVAPRACCHSIMEFLASLFLKCVLVAIVIVLVVVHTALAPSVHVKGNTNIPGPTDGWCWPIIGHALYFMGLRNMSDMYALLRRLTKMRDKVMKVWIGAKLTIFIMDAKYAEVLMSSAKAQMKDVDFYKAFEYLLSGGVFSYNGKRWSDLRRPLDRLLHQKYMDMYFNVFLEKTQQLCEKLEAKCDKGIFDVYDIIKYYTVDVTLETMLGVPGTQMANNTLNFPEALSRNVGIVFQKMLRLEYKFDWLFDLTKTGREATKNRDEMRQTSKFILETRYKDYAARGLNPKDPDFRIENYSDAVFQLAERNGWPSELNCVGHLTMVIAGADTSSVAISSAIFFLAMHPEYQEKAYQEQIRIMGDSLETPTQEEVNRMEYLGMVYNETLRFCCPPGVGRVLTSEIELDGYIFPEGATLYFVIHDIQRNPKYWERPNDFYPDHFLPENVAVRPKGAFMPFSSGARSCPGKQFTQILGKTVLSMLIRKFKLKSPMTFHEVTFKYMLMTESENGYPVEITHRTRSTK